MSNKFTKIKEKFGFTLFCILLLLFFAIPIILFQTFISAGLFSFLGVSFESKKSLINFLFLFAGLSFIPEFISDLTVQAFKDLAFLNNKKGLILDFIISIPTKVILFLIADIIIPDVEITLFSAIVVSIILFSLEKVFNKFLDDIPDKKGESMEEATLNMESSLEKFENKNLNNKNNLNKDDDDL